MATLKWASVVLDMAVGVSDRGPFPGHFSSTVSRCLNGKTAPDSNAFSLFYRPRFGYGTKAGELSFCHG